MKQPKFYNTIIEGQTHYKTVLDGTRKFTKAYTIWNLIRIRCYSDKFLIKNPSYKGCTVSPLWYNFQNFAEWFYINCVEGWQLDKDILVKGNKIYSPDTCCFVPAIINTQIQKISNKSIYGLGVSKDKNRNKFYIKILIEGKRKYFGFDNLIEAQDTYKKYKKNLISNLAIEFKDNLKENVYEKLINYTTEDYE